MLVAEINSGTVNRQGPSSRAWLRLLAALSLAVGMVIAVALPVIATVNFDTVFDLSKRAKVQIKSGYPDIEASADGKYVAVVWSRGYDNEPDTKDSGYIVLKSALTGTNTTADGWENQVNVYVATASVWGVRPRAAFDPRDSGKLYVTWVQCQDKVANCNRIMVNTCTLTGTDRCGTPEVVYTASGTSPNLTAPDIAADDGGRLHVIWKNETSGSKRIQYSRKSGGSWSGAVAVNDTDLDSFNPALAWSSGDGGRLHLVWYQYDSGDPDCSLNESLDPSLCRIWYKYASPTVGDWSGTGIKWRAPVNYRFTGYAQSGISESYTKPSIAVSGTNVYLAWDVYKGSDQFVLAYDWNADDGDGAQWQDSESNFTGTCGSGSDGCGIPDAVLWNDNPSYWSPFGSSLYPAIAEEHLLRPSITVSGTVPAITWHYKKDDIAGENVAYVIAYRESITTGGSIAWPTEPINIIQNINYDPATGTNYDDSANPDLAVAPDSGVHIAHMGMWGGNRLDPDSDWDIYYRGDIRTDNSTDDVQPVYLPLVLKNK